MNTIRNLCICTLLLLHTSVISQIEWERLDPLPGDGLKLLHISEEGRYLAQSINPFELLMSKDKGLSWEPFYKGSHMHGVIKSIIKQDDQGKYFFFIREDQDIKFFDQNKAIMNVGSNVDDVEILSSGNLVVSSGRGATVRLLSNWGKELKKIDLKKLIVFEDQEEFLMSQITLDKVGNIKLFMKSNSRIILLSLNTDLTLSGPILTKIDTDIEHLYFREGRFYSSIGYSDSGSRWQEYQIEGDHQIIDFRVGKEGQLILLADEACFVSNNNGESFQMYEIPVFVSLPRLFLDEDGLVILYGTVDDGLNNSDVYFGFDEGLNHWTDISDKFIGFNKVNVRKIEAGFDGNVFAATGNVYNYYKRSEDEDWQHFFNEDEIIYYDIRFSYLEVLANGKIISTPELYSLDGGQTWSTEEAQLYHTVSGLIVKNDIPYLLHGDNDYFIAYHSRSLDFGENWEDINPHASGYDFWSPITVFANGKTIYTGENSGDQSQTYLMDETGSLEEILINPFDDTTDFTMGYTHESSYDTFNLYFLSSSMNMITFSNYSMDEEKILFSRSLEAFVDEERPGIHVDHKDNIYVFNKDQIWLSQNKGADWVDITPYDVEEVESINDLDLGYDNYLYLATSGAGVLKSVEMLETTEIDHRSMEFSKHMQCFPNPFDQVINIIYENSDELSLRVFDIHGKLRYHALCQGTEHRIDLGTLPAGCYLIQLMDGEKMIEQRKVMKI